MNLSQYFDHTPDNIALICGSQHYRYAELKTLCSEKNLALTAAGAQQNCIIAIELENSLEAVITLLTCFIYGYSALMLNPKDSKSNADILSKNKVNLHITHNSITKHSDQIRFQKSYLICFTSGTTGTPKGVCHPFENIIANALAFNNASGINHETRLLHVFPISYMAGILNTLISPLVASGTVILSAPFSAEKISGFWDDLIEHNCNTTWLTPTIISFVTATTRNTETLTAVKERLKLLLVGTAPLLQDKKAQFEAKFGIDCIESYGMSEILLVSANFQKTERSVGQPLNGIEVKTSGNLFVSSPFAFDGYLIDDIWHPANIEHGFFDTGDIAEIKDQQIMITGRQKDLIIKGGKNISPRFIEETIIMHPQAQDVAVIGTSHPFWGEDIVAFVETESEDTDSFSNFCKEQIDRELLPSKIHLIKSFPRNRTGKIMKNKLMEYI